jgi:hypothetical protein
VVTAVAEAALVAAASAVAVLAEAVSVRPLSEAEVSAQPLLRAVDFVVEPSQPMVSAAAVSTTGADLRSVHSRTTIVITVIRTTTTATTIPTMAMAAATWCSGACIPGMAGVSDLSRCAADPGLRRMEGDDLIWRATWKVHAVSVYSVPSPLF